MGARPDMKLARIREADPMAHLPAEAVLEIAAIGDLIEVGEGGVIRTGRGHVHLVLDGSFTRQDRGRTEQAWPSEWLPAGDAEWLATSPALVLAVDARAVWRFGELGPVAGRDGGIPCPNVVGQRRRGPTVVIAPAS